MQKKVLSLRQSGITKTWHNLRWTPLNLKIKLIFDFQMNAGDILQKSIRNWPGIIFDIVIPLGDVFETVANPEYIYKCIEEEIFAAKEISNGKLLVVIYREYNEVKDGFIITAFFTKRKKSLEKERIDMEEINVSNYLNLASGLLKIPFENVLYSYDKEADVLYMGFSQGMSIPKNRQSLMIAN